MSKAPLMIDCPRCVNRVAGRVRRPLGVVERVIERRNLKITYTDVCERCGGSGRIPITMQETSAGHYRMTLKMSKYHKVEMREWLAKEKELLYGKAERLE